MEQRARITGMLSRTYYIQRNYQSRVVLQFCMLALTGTALFCAVFYYFMDGRIGTRYGQALSRIRHVAVGLTGYFWLAETLAVVFLVVGVVILMVLMSHRIAGPLWRVEQSAKAIADGDLTVSVKFRKDDEMQQLADQMNGMVDGLRSRVYEIKNLSMKLTEQAELLDKRVSASGFKGEECTEILTDIMDTVQDLGGRLNAIKTQ